MENNGRVFVDANVFIALFNKDDSLHVRGVQLWEMLQSEGVLLYTSIFVLSETLTVLRLRAGKQAAHTFARVVFDETAVLSVLYPDREDTHLAYNIFRQVVPKDFSFVDATIVAFARKWDLHVITFDKNLAKVATTS